MPNVESSRNTPDGRIFRARSQEQSPRHAADPDADIVELARSPATRRVAIGVLYERFQRRVYNTSLRVVGDADEASDILQDVFVLLFRKIHKFRARSTFASWVYRITVNLSLDRLRQRKRNPLLGMAGSALDSLQDDMGRGAPEHGAALQDLEEHVQAALDDLSPRLRIVIVLRYLEGLSYQDIAAILSCSLGTVKSRLNRAHAILRRTLAPMYQGKWFSDARTA
ncbi:MAG: sigma-70 family RNA polymerase sigma factor [Planctomycetota bacterium]